MLDLLDWLLDLKQELRLVHFKSILAHLSNFTETQKKLICEDISKGNCCITGYKCYQVTFQHTKINQILPRIYHSILPLNFDGATKLYFMHYSHVVIISFITGFYKSAYSTYSFGKTRSSFDYVLVLFRFFVFLYLWFLVFSLSILYFECNVISKDFRTIA